MSPMMNPMMAAMNPMMMANPMMANTMMANPMMAMMGSMMMGGGMPSMPNMMAAAAAPPAAVEAPAPAAAPMEDGPAVDPQIRDLCRTFNIEDRLMRKLNRVMLGRPESFDEDVQTLRERLGEPRADIGVLITQLEKGLFVSMGCMPKPMVALVKKYNLDDRASQRLAESMMRRKQDMDELLKDLDVRLASAERPSGLLMTLLQGLDTTGRLPAPPRSLGLPSGHRDQRNPGGHQPADRSDREQQRRGGGRSRSRSRKDRSRSKSRKRR
mmetsp:Transcript_78900/g.241448  ORF Transcript_78900/g.241448 Transcript_78900/m.241448 type:complete len:269 (-) Transcript_78900:42-848(-)